MRLKDGSSTSSPSSSDAKKIKIDAEEAIPKTRCQYCRQWLNVPTTLLYQGHPNRAVDQYTALFTDSIRIDLGDDQLPQFRITHFAFYDLNGHLVSLDSGIIERNETLYMSGYLKAVTDDEVGDTDFESGVPVYDVGPILQWWNGGFDGGESENIGVSTEEAEFYLGIPSSDYKPLWREVLEKSKLTKVVIEFLENARTDDGFVSADYEDLILKINETPLEDGVMLSQEALHKNAAFVIDQVNSYDEAAVEDNDDDDDDNDDDVKNSKVFLTQSECMKDLIKFSGIHDLKNRKLAQKIKTYKLPQKVKPSKTALQASKATLTPLVRDIFEVLFEGQIAETDQDNKNAQQTRDKRCGVCHQCQKPDCGKCKACKDMVKFQGSGKSKQACEQRKCPNMGYYDCVTLDDSLDDLEILNEEMPHTQTKHKIKSKKKRVIEWPDFEPSSTIKGIRYYERVLIDGEEFCPGDFVMVRPDEEGVPSFVAYIINLLDDDDEDGPSAHVVWFTRGCDTVLGDTCNPRELFVLIDCETIPLSAVSSKATVIHFPPQDNWKDLGGTNESLLFPILKNDDTSFFYRLKYEDRNCRFEYLDRELESFRIRDFKCGMCPLVGRRDNSERINLLDGAIEIKNEIYKVNDAVFLKPSAFDFRFSVEKWIESKNEEWEEQRKEKINHHKYPEKYRKNKHVKGSNCKTPNPFCIGIITEILPMAKGKAKLLVRKMYRPENTHMLEESPSQCWNKNINYLYWSDLIVKVDAETVEGKCYVRPEMSLNVSVREWTHSGQYRFYYNEVYDPRAKEFKDLSSEAEKYGHSSGKGKGKGKSSIKQESSKMNEDDLTMNEYPPVPRRLRTLDVFAGCGGLSKGMYDSGISEPTWAIEIFQPAASAFKANHPECTVFTDDCNKLLENVINGKEYNDKKQKLPQKGEVELLCGGPPCQGFSGMNRFNHREYSLFKNSLVTSYLSYCDYYRPQYFILENVRNFASFKKCMVLKMCMSSLVRMGYQCTFSILQAGNFGIAQTRRRAILMAAAPGQKLPMYPEPLHVFAKTSLSVQVNDKIYESNVRWKESAPYRTITVRDTMSDLPVIKNGHQVEVMKYETAPESPFQKLMREEGGKENGVRQLRDHIVKTMAPLIEARMSLIPTLPGSDWRDLPNIKMELSDGSCSDILIYPHNDYIQGKSPVGTLRGVCVCATSKKAKCDPMDKQGNTLIPWCLPHTGNRHNHWSGLYGRLEWDGFFSTTVTNPEPMGKQGRVLHPEQHRLVSVRECARSQGFPDNFKFVGSILEKHRQVGNAVPPPMGLALGLEIRKAAACIIKKDFIDIDTTTLNSNNY